MGSAHSIERRKKRFLFQHPPMKVQRQAEQRGGAPPSSPRPHHRQILFASSKNSFTGGFLSAADFISLYCHDYRLTSLKN